MDMIKTPRLRRKPTSSSGFTIIELITVLMIIGVMTGIAGGQYTEYRGPDRTGAGRARSGQLRVAHQIIRHPAAEPR